MMRSLLCSLLVIVSIAAFARAEDTQMKADDVAIGGRITAFKAAWDKDDFAAMAEVMGPDATLINPVGKLATGEKEIAALVAGEHAGIFKGTKYEVIDMRFQTVTPDVKVVDITAKITGMKTPDGAAAPDFEHHVTWVFAKKDGQWFGVVARPYQFVKVPDAK